MVRAFYSAVVLLFLTAGCIRGPKTPQPAPAPVVATPETPPPAPAPAPVTKAPSSTTKGKAAPPVTKTPAPKAQAPKPVAPVASAARPRETAAGPALDLNALKTQLKETKAIGVFTKLTLKNQVDDLLAKFREHHAGKAKPTITELRSSYDLLMMKVLSLLQDHDQKLASAIVSSRETIWGLLADPKRFAALQA